MKSTFCNLCFARSFITLIVIAPAIVGCGGGGGETAGRGKRGQIYLPHPTA